MHFKWNHGSPNTSMMPVRVHNAYIDSRQDMIDLFVCPVGSKACYDIYIYSVCVCVCVCVCGCVHECVRHTSEAIP